MPEQTNLVIAATGTLVGLIVVLIEELEKAGSLSRSQITQRLDVLLHANANAEAKSPADALETEIISELRAALAPPASNGVRLTVITGSVADQ